MNRLIAKCKCGVHLNINNHKDYYQTVEQYLKDLSCVDQDVLDIEPDVYQKMVEQDTIIELQFYPNTPIGSYKVYHYDLDIAITKALEV